MAAHPVIPTAQETEAKGPQVQSQPQQLSEALSILVKCYIKIKNKNGWGCNSVAKHPGFNPWYQKTLKNCKIKRDVLINSNINKLVI